MIIRGNNLPVNIIITANCTDGEIRLVGGSTDREGRVEVCENGTQWRTVCTGSKELAGAVCSQMGYIFEGNGGSMTLLLIPLAIPSTGSSVAKPNKFPPGTFPEYRLECTGGECTAVKANCTNSSMELGVVCKNYEDIYKECSMNCTLPVTTTLSSTTFIAGIGVLVALLLAVSVGWIVSCVILLRRGQTDKQQ